MNPPSDPSSFDSTTPPPAAGAPKPTPPKPAFKVTRSPFAPKITGTATPISATSAASSATRPGMPMKAISIGAAATLEGVSADRPGVKQAPVARSAPMARRRKKTSLGGLMVDLIAAAGAVAVAVLMVLDYMSKTH